MKTGFKRCLNCNRVLMVDKVTKRYKHAAFTVRRKGQAIQVDAMFACFVPIEKITTGMLLDDSIFYRRRKNADSLVTKEPSYSSTETATWHPTIQ